MNMQNSPNNNTPPSKKRTGTPRYAIVRWITAGAGLLILTAALIYKVATENEFTLIYAILLGFVVLVSIAWVAFTPAVLGFKKK